VKMDTIVVGIDVSKDKLDIALRPGGEVFCTSRDAQGLDALVARLAPLSPAAVAVEATGGFETVVAASLAAAGLPVVVVNPAQVRSFAQALGKRAKTDPIDALVIAHFAEAAKPDIRPLPDDATQLLSDLTAAASCREAFAKEHRAPAQSSRKGALVA
jgi:transposase